MSDDEKFETKPVEPKTNGTIRIVCYRSKNDNRQEVGTIKVVRFSDDATAMTTPADQAAKETPTVSPQTEENEKEQTPCWLVTELKTNDGSPQKYVRIGMRLLRAAVSEIEDMHPEAEFNGLYALATLGENEAQLHTEPTTAGTKAAKIKIELLQSLGAEIVPLTDKPPTSDGTQKCLISFSPSLPNAGRIVATGSWIIDLAKKLGLIEKADEVKQALKVIESAKSIRSSWNKLLKEQESVLTTSGFRWNQSEANRDPFPSFEYDLLAKAFTGSRREQPQASPNSENDANEKPQNDATSQSGTNDNEPDCIDLESPVIGQEESKPLNCAVALHFVAKAPDKAKPDQSQSLNEAILESKLITLGKPHPVTVIIPSQMGYAAEGEEKSLQIEESDDERHLKFNAHLSRTRVRRQTDVVHVVLRPEDETRITVYDLIKISKLWAGGEESLIKGDARDQIKFLAGDNTRQQTFTEFTQWVRENINQPKDQPSGQSSEPGGKEGPEKHDEQSGQLQLQAGTIQLVVKDEAGREAVQEIIQIAQGDKGNPTAPEERSARLNRSLLELAGIKTSILDFEYVDALEIDETFSQPVMKDCDDIFIGLQKGTLVHYSEGDRAFDNSKSDIGISPYLLLPHAVLLHNEKCLFEAQAEANKTLGGSKTGDTKEDASIQTLRTAELEIRKRVQQQLVPNVFQYPTEQAIYDFGHENRGLNKLRASLDEQLKGINGRLEEMVDKKKYSSEFFLVIAGVLIGVGQLMSGWSGMRDLFFDQPKPIAKAEEKASGKTPETAPQSAAVNTGAIEPTAAVAVPKQNDESEANSPNEYDQGLQFLFQTAVIATLLVMLAYTLKAWLTLVELHGLAKEESQGKARKFFVLLLFFLGLASSAAFLINAISPWIKDITHSTYWVIGSTALAVISASVLCWLWKLDLGEEKKQISQLIKMFRPKRDSNDASSSASSPTSANATK